MRITTAISASPTRLFAVLTDPAHFAAWWSCDATRLHCRAILRRGGKWRVLANRGEHAGPVAHGQYLIVDAPRVLAFTCQAAGQDSLVTIVRFELAPLDVLDAHGTRGTRLLLRHTGFAGRSDAGRALAEVWRERLGRVQTQLHDRAD